MGRGIEQGLHAGAQLYVSLKNGVIVNDAVGETSSGTPMTLDTPLPWLSSGKPLIAVAIAQLWERRLLDLDDPVAKHIPGFAAGGKEKITIRHILTHTAGFRAAIGLREDQSWDLVIAAINATRIEPRWIPGQTAGYHPLTSWYVLGELVHVLDGRPFERYVDEMIVRPLGMNGTSYVEKNRHAPGASASGPARDLARFYQMMLRRGETIVTPQTAEAMTAHHRVGVFDKTFNHVIDFGLGFVLQSNRYGVDTVPYNYGPHASPRTFGHSGARSSIGYCDPEHGLVVACIFDGRATEAQHDARMREVNAAIYEELGLTR
jgi:CubicO group peptidase (beta-lactamase class C family)